MSICSKCRYRVDGRIWCLKFDPQNWPEWLNHTEKMKDGGLTKCELFKSEKPDNTENEELKNGK